MRENWRQEVDSTAREFPTVASRDGTSSSVCARDIADRALEDWKRGDYQDASAVLAAHPELLAHRTIVIELAHEEYTRRRQSGEQLEARDFADGFPGFETSLYLFINVQSLLGESAPSAEVFWPRLGESFMGYRIVEELGRGAFARVFLASEEAVGERLVALKVASHGADEATVLGRLNHPSIVPVHSVQSDSERGVTAVCMPFLGRATLTDVLDAGFAKGCRPRHAKDAFHCVRRGSNGVGADGVRRFSEARGSYEDEVVQLGVQLADALAHSHERGVCHRDIKPSNVLMAFDGTPLLLDFNLSIDASSWLDRVGGTLPYMAPEDLKHVAGADTLAAMRADPRSDLFSLGVILYQLLSGRLPFDPQHRRESITQTADDLLALHASPPPSIRENAPDVSRALEDIVFDCLKDDPEERIQTASELARRLRKYFRRVPSVRRWIRRRPRRVAAVAGIVSLILTISALHMALRPPYAERKLAEGFTCLERAEYEDALNCFGEVLRHDRDSVEALMARGEICLLRDDYEAAFLAFNSARKLSDSSTSAAATAYCAAMLGNEDEALVLYSRAYEQGDRSVPLLNNLAFLLLQRNRVADAEQALNAAIDIDPTNPVLAHNLLRCHLRRCVDDRKASAGALLIATDAAAFGTPSAELYHDISAIFAIAARDDPSHADTAMKWLRLSIDKGLPRKNLSDPLFSALRDLPEFDRLGDSTTALVETRPAQRLLSPIPLR